MAFKVSGQDMLSLLCCFFLKLEFRRLPREEGLFSLCDRAAIVGDVT